MDAELPAAATASPLQQAMEQVRTTIEHVVKLVDDGAHTDLGALGLVGCLQDWERLRNLMPVVDAALIQYGIEQDVPRTLVQRSMSQVLATGLRLSVGEARRRVKAAEHLSERRSLLGEPLPRIRPHLAAAQRDGDLTPDQVTVIDDALRGVDRCDPAAVDHGEQILVQAAASLPPALLRQLAEKVVEAIEPDGALPEEAEQQRRRFLQLSQRRDGSWVGQFRLTAELGRKLSDLLAPLTKPATTSHPTDRGAGRFVEDDDRSLGQRRHDALHAIIDRLLRRDDNPDTGGTPATLLITVNQADLHTRTGMAHHSDGTTLTVATALRLADQAEIVCCSVDGRGAVLDLHRTRRIASKDQTLALYARDRGCTFPGCDVDPVWCERHHIIPWWNGGATNLQNLTLLCQFHHHQFERRGWTCQIQHGLPHWIPPKWIDRHQKPILHNRITIATWQPHDPLDL